MRAESEVLLAVVRQLDLAAIPYMLSGSMALNFYAQPRMTRDVDLVVELHAKDAERIVALFEPDFACDLEEIQSAIRSERMFNLIHTEKVVKVDFIVRKSTAYRKEEFQRRRRVEFLGTPIWVVAAEDLVLSKLAWAKDSHSDFQLRDVRNVLRMVKDLDWPYLEQWAGDLEVEELLTEVRS